MKVIISHDVDHITAWEHWNDLMIPKFLIRSLIHLFFGRIYGHEMITRLLRIAQGKWHNLNELMIFNQKMGVPATFFMGVNQGKGLAYNVVAAEYWISQIMQAGFDVGVHGISFNNYQDMMKEYQKFKSITKLSAFGIRMHYLRNDGQTLELLAKLGYRFDSSVYEMRAPFLQGKMIEIPLHLMDVYLDAWNLHRTQALSAAIEETKEKINQAEHLRLPYLTVLFHDRYYSREFILLKCWYEWLIEFLKESKIELISYDKAVQELLN